ncbi:MAG: LemA family protein [Armatimonadetes bacterium]|nr:LemA family protein [Armatimonadota bacterium]
MTWIAIIVVVVLFLLFIGMYNGLVRSRVEVDNAFSQIDVQLKRRYDLIPNLVETVKGYMNFEQTTLEKVIQARNMALGAKSVNEKAAADGQVTSALNGFFAIAESYPDLKANQNMLSLQEELKSTENKISFARQYYNDSVTAYNTKLQVFPSSIIASMGGFTPRDLFVVENATERENVQVKF